MLAAVALESKFYIKEVVKVMKIWNPQHLVREKRQVPVVHCPVSQAETRSSWLNERTHLKREDSE
jgi:hypothetical protein